MAGSARRSVVGLIALTLLQIALWAVVFYMAVVAALGLDACTYRGCGPSWWGAQAINLAVLVAAAVLIVTVVWGIVVTVRGRAGRRIVGAGCVLQVVIAIALLVVRFV